MGRGKAYTREEVEFCRNNIWRLNYTGLCKELEEQFGRKVSEKVLRRNLLKYGVSRGANQTQLCWFCQNAIPTRDGRRGCSWSTKFEPVPGWDAEETVLYQEANGRQMALNSYRIISCPQFVEDEPRVEEWELEDEQP